jgi:hypothetical protein
MYLDVSFHSGVYVLCIHKLIQFSVTNLYRIQAYRNVKLSLGREFLIIQMHCNPSCLAQCSDIDRIFQEKVVKGKVQFTLEQAMKAQRGSRGIALLFL